jgi:hypothetical protein
MNKPRPRFFSLLFDLLIDSALIGAGVALYYHFEVLPILPFSLHPAVIALFGSEQTVTLFVSLAPLSIGLISLTRTLYTTLAGLVSTVKNSRARR